MPAIARRDDDGRPLFQRPERSERLRFRFLERPGLHHLAFAVEAVELGGNAPRFQRVFRHQEAQAERGVPDAPARIDAWSQQEAEVIGRRRSVEPRHVHEGLEAGILAAPHHGEAARHEGPVEPRQRHHVGNRPQCDEIEQTHEIGFGPRRRPVPLAAQVPVERHHQHEGDPGGTELPEAG